VVVGWSCGYQRIGSGEVGVDVPAAVATTVLVRVGVLVKVQSVPAVLVGNIRRMFVPGVGARLFVF